MSEDEKSKSIDVGFIAGQVLTLKLTEADHKALLQAIDGNSGWHQVAATDADFVIDLNKVTYVRTATGESRVGFSGD